MSNVTVRVESSLCEKISFHGWKCLALYFSPFWSKRIERKVERWKWLSFRLRFETSKGKRNGDGNDELFPLSSRLFTSFPFPPPLRIDFFSLTGLINHPISPLSDTTFWHLFKRASRVITRCSFDFLSSLFFLYFPYCSSILSWMWIIILCASCLLGRQNITIWILVRKLKRWGCGFWERERKVKRWSKDGRETYREYFILVHSSSCIKSFWWSRLLSYYRKEIHSLCIQRVKLL